MRSKDDASKAIDRPAGSVATRHIRVMCALLTRVFNSSIPSTAVNQKVEQAGWSDASLLISSKLKINSILVRRGEQRRAGRGSARLTTHTGLRR
jgi:hypothetical protein